MGFRQTMIFLTYLNEKITVLHMSGFLVNKTNLRFIKILKFIL